MLLELFGARGVQSQVGRLLDDQPTMKGRDKHLPMRTAVLLTSFILLSIPVNELATV
jgi:hypothetical protein